MKFFNLLREPFILIIFTGIVLYFAYSSLYNYVNRDKNIVVVTSNEIMQMEQSWESRWNRQPTAKEREGLLKQHIREIVLYRTALEMGLDIDDRVIRGRMVQKLEFLGNDLIRPPQPSEQDLVTFYDKHKQQYIPEEMITITHIYFDPDKREDETLADADKAMQALSSKGDFDGNLSGYGDAFMLQNYYPNRSKLEIRKLFGNGFAESVFQLEPEKWHSPVLSGYGTHLVYIHTHQISELPPFNDVREQVIEDWMADMQQKLNDRYIEGLMARYKVVIEDNQQ